MLTARDARRSPLVLVGGTSYQNCPFGCSSTAQVGAGSWADCALNCLCYDKCPGQLQLAIRKAFEHGTRKIKIPGTEVVPVPLFEVGHHLTTLDRALTGINF